MRSRPNGIASPCELVDDIARYDTQRKASEARIRAAVAASGTTLTEIFGIGDVIAATLIGHTGDVARFATAETIRRLQRHRPDRVVVGEPEAADASAVAAREPHDEPCAAHRRGHPDPPRAQSRPRSSTTANAPKATPPRAAIRALKRRISNVVYRHLVADARRAQQAMKRVREGNQGRLSNSSVAG